MDQKVTAYVPAWNAERTLGECLESLLSQTVPFDEVLVIDDGSKDRTAEVAARYGVRLARNGVNRGLGYTRNVGLTQAHNELVASVDSDCTLEPVWLERLLPCMDDARVACAGGALSEAYANSPSDLWRSRHLPQSWGSTRLVNPRFLFGCNLLSRKSLVQAAGGYDQAFRTNGEDVDLSRRLQQMGFLLIYEPGARACHLQQDTAWSVMGRWWRWHHSGPSGASLHSAARNSPQYLVRGLGFAIEDLRHSPQLVPLDLAFPFAQVYLDAHRDGARTHQESRKPP